MIFTLSRSTEHASLATAGFFCCEGVRLGSGLPHQASTFVSRYKSPARFVAAQKHFLAIVSVGFFF
jgi:hypothetical protein